MAQPSFKMMWDAFPDHVNYPTLRSLFNFIGGTLVKNIDSPGFGPTGNTCAVRMSRALNYGNFPVSAKMAKALDISTMTGADGMLPFSRARYERVFEVGAGGDANQGHKGFPLFFFR